ncbi:MAG TPA: toll/interleukin-1 receptor domain-containing protein [Ktedonobacteraceae bacterium]|nr:toll/interleukin-1 receptor domain-containing protein [Ktedonobacteraceae bacterium]
MANQEHMERLRQGVVIWNAWREENPEIQADLSGADLVEADLSGADLSGANLSGANLGYANLNKANLNSANLNQAELSLADLSEANLNKANLSEANLSVSDLSGANLNGADLSNADLSRAYLTQADLNGAIFGGTILINIDLRRTKGLAEIQHRGISPFHLPSLQLPQDGSALHFLRGVGLTDDYIDFWRSISMLPIQYHSVFISYSSKDETLARRFHADLQASGVRCWFAPEDLKIGTRLRQRIDEAIHLQDKLLLLLSERSIASTWVETEVEAALEKEDRQKREVLFPVRLDDAVMQTTQAWAAKLRRDTNIGDFTNWTDPQAYQHAFDRLLRDLKKADE